MKNRTFVNRAIAIATAIAVAIQPTTVLATENPTSASTKVKYYGADPYYTVVVPTSIQLDEKGQASFNLRAEGDLGNWVITNKSEMCTNFLGIFIYIEDEEGVSYPGCYLYQDGKEPIFAEFHEEASDKLALNGMSLVEGIENYKDSLQECTIHFCNPQPTWVRNVTPEDLFPGNTEIYNGMTQEQFSNLWYGYDFGTTVPITVNLEGNKPVPAGDWEGEIVIYVSKYIVRLPIICQEAQDAYDELIANKQ